jgi:hypothetical protein
VAIADSFKVTEQFYSGTSFSNWFQLLNENSWGISGHYLLRAGFVTLAALVSLPFRLYEEARFRRQVEATTIEKPPVFILGHWRSGTTYLHVLLAQDQRFAYASNLQVVMPGVFLGSRPIFERLMRRYMPHKRWMDNFALEPNLPSEDEFAIANLCPYSMYHSMAFPRNRYRYVRYCTWDGVPARVTRAWQKVVLHFFKKLTLQSKSKQLLLKNPTYTSRIPLLLELFPQARFIHICRNPYDVFRSTLRMYEKMLPSFYVQDPQGGVDEAKEYILHVYQRMYEKYLADRARIPRGNLVEVRYEDFVQDPLREVQRIYAGLGLADFTAAEESFRAYAAVQRSFQVNENVLDEATRQEVAGRWGFAFEAWGYPR